MKKALAIGALPVLFLVVTAFQSSNSVPGQLTAIQTQISNLASQNSSLMSQISSLEAQVASSVPRKFYVTPGFSYDGAQALSACAEGYHMASLWEIREPSNLRYDTNLGLTLSDTGFGPPTAFGWIRTGGSAVATAIPVTGSANCNGWTSNSGGHYGTGATLSNSWGAAAVRISPWQADSAPCSVGQHVWCVQD